MQMPSAMIIAALGNSSWRIIADVHDDPRKSLQILDSRCISNRSNSLIAVERKLFRKRYAGQGMTEYTDQYSSCFSQLEFMSREVAIPEANKTAMLLASIDPDKELGAAAALHPEETKRGYRRMCFQNSYWLM